MSQGRRRRRLASTAGSRLQADPDGTMFVLSKHRRVRLLEVRLSLSAIPNPGMQVYTHSVFGSPHSTVGRGGKANQDRTGRRRPPASRTLVCVAPRRPLLVALVSLRGPGSPTCLGTERRRRTGTALPPASIFASSSHAHPISGSVPASTAPGGSRRYDHAIGRNGITQVRPGVVGCRQRPMASASGCRRRRRRPRTTHVTCWRCARCRVGSVVVCTCAFTVLVIVVNVRARVARETVPPIKRI